MEAIKLEKAMDWETQMLLQMQQEEYGNELFAYGAYGDEDQANNGSGGGLDVGVM